ncbi:hypothetical protein MUK42_25809 [Musa troglodytarum]|uniref:Transmembrane protein n=2 Tax=Musa troglodytarum TaxID=320322 RepID=A0A9E7HDD1_9LILI|nr:hypothetical protein MUK42_25809 [Musa troglodytarum]
MDWANLSLTSGLLDLDEGELPPPTMASPCVQASINLMSRLRNVALATGLLAFAAAGLLFPFFLATSRSKPVIDASRPLPPQATFRGPYVNTGSHDIGPDTTTYTKK